MKFKKPKKLMLFIWDDAFGVPAGWEFEEDIELTTSRVCSVGFLLSEDENTLTIAPHIGGNNKDRQQYAGVITIPKRQIVAISSCELVDLAPELARMLQQT